MRTPGHIRILLILAAVVICGGAVDAVPSGERLQQAIYAEEIEGDLTAAIAGYDEILNDASASSDQMALALYRQGMCYYRLDEKGQATVALTRLASQFPGQTNLVGKTLPILEKLKFFDPALLMPPETLAYFELGRGEGQHEMNQKMFKDMPLEDLILALSQSNPEVWRSGPQMLMAGLMNPAMEEDFNKIRGMAVGLVDIQPNGPSVVAVLHLGESMMLRSMLMTGLSMGGMPGAKIEGMSTFSFQGQAEVAYDDQVFLISSIPGKLPWMVRQYKHLSNEDSMAAVNPLFGELNQAM
ncbi:MAG TPA: tetratricopeptide repeat protein, partial [Pontiella sp.]|nr:tetratricopeptide repeat protein [Pontiella sp.]